MEGSETKENTSNVAPPKQEEEITIADEEVKKKSEEVPDDENKSKEDGPKPAPPDGESGEITGEKSGKGETTEELPSMESRAPASCKYRWAKTVLTSSSEVIFFSSHKPNEPVVLSWNPAQAVFYSSEMQVASGDYKGNVVVEGRTYPVEEFSVRPYTFEVDLYIKDDIIEDEVPANQTQLVEEQFKENHQAKEVDTYRDINTDLAGLPNMDGGDGSINVTSKYEELIRQQMQQKDMLDTSLDNEVTIMHKSELSDSLNGSVRHTPIGDVAVESFKDGDDGSHSNPSSVHGSIHGSVHGSTHGSVNGSTHGSVHGSTHGSVHGSTHGSVRESPQWDAVDAGRSSVLDDLEKTSIRSRNSSARQTPQSGVEDILRTSYPRPSSRNGSEVSGSYHESKRHTPDIINGDAQLNGTSLERSLSQTSGERPSSIQGSHHGSVTEAVDDILEKYTRGSRREKIESIDDVVESPSRSSHSSLRQTPQQDLIKDDLSLPGSQRATPQRDVITDSFRHSTERLYSSQELHRETSNRPGSSGSHRSGSSRPQSVTSEQELTQYLDHQRGEYGPRRAASLTHLHQTDPLLPPISASDLRTGSAASMPPLPSNIDRLSTPENHIRTLSGGSPQIRSPLITGRTGSASRGSSRTVTPQSGIGAPTENGFREDGRRTQDYEDTITNLQKLLSGRDVEVKHVTQQMDDLREINRSLRDELELKDRGSRNSGRSSRDIEKQYEQMKNEKDILAVEVVKLRDQLASVTGKNHDSMSIDSYSPNNPLALQRKIADLEGHIQDMQEANETAMSHLTKAEKQVKELTKENSSLRKRQSHSLQDLEDDNRRLHDKIHLLEDGSPGDYRQRVEIQQLKDDLRALRDRNYQLNEENIRLKEGGASRLEESTYSHDLKKGRETSQKTEDISRLDSRQKTERSPLTQKNISYLERSFGSDKDVKDYKYNLTKRMESSYLDSYKMDKHLTSGYERSRSEQTRSNRSVPDGQVSEKLVTDLGRYGQRSYDHHKSEKDILSRERSEREVYPSDRSRERERDRHDRRGRNYDNHNSQGSIDSRGQYESRYKNYGYYSDVLSSTAPIEMHAGRSHDHESHLRKRHFSYDGTYNKDYDIPRKNTTEENGELSDTATEILLNSDALDRKPHRSRNRRRQSVESVDSVSSLSDEEHRTSRRKRSKSVDARGDWVGRRTPTGSPSRTTPSTLRISASTERLSQHAQLSPGSAGFRSHTPTPLTTQHNKGMLGSPVSSLSSSLTQGMRPFAPRTPGDMKVEDVVKFSRQGGKLSQGSVKFIGHLPGRGDVYLGVELDKEEGKHDGTFEGIRYFKCKSSKGVFVAFNKVVMAWAP